MQIDRSRGKRSNCGKPQLGMVVPRDFIIAPLQVPTQLADHSLSYPHVLATKRRRCMAEGDYIFQLSSAELWRRVVILSLLEAATSLFRKEDFFSHHGAGVQLVLSNCSTPDELACLKKLCVFFNITYTALQAERLRFGQWLDDHLFDFPCLAEQEQLPYTAYYNLTYLSQQ